MRLMRWGGNPEMNEGEVFFKWFGLGGGERWKPYGTSLAILDADFSTLVKRRLLSSSLALISSSFWFMVSMRSFKRLRHPQARNKMGNMSNVFTGSLLRL